MKNKIDSLQVIRALAFIGILSSHSNVLAFFPGGAWGVTVFLILSGFLMVCSYYDTDRIKENGLIYNVKFGIGKVKKLYPLHVIMMFVAFPFLIAHSVSIIKSLTIIFLNSSLLQSWVPYSEYYFSLNAVSWYLSVSLFLYVLFPVILVLMKKYRGKNTARIVLGCVFFVQVLLTIIAYILEWKKLICIEDFALWFTYIFPLSRLEEFFIGCNLGYIFLKREKNKDINQIWASFLEIGTLLIIVLHWIIYLKKVTFPENAEPTASIGNWWELGGIWTISTCCLIYLFALNKGLVSKLLTNRILIFIGNISANGFLIHQMVYRYINLFEERIIGKTNKVLNLFLCFALTVFLSFIWDLIMKTFRKNKQKK